MARRGSVQYDKIFASIAPVLKDVIVRIWEIEDTDTHELWIQWASGATWIAPGPFDPAVMIRPHRPGRGGRRLLEPLG